MAPDMSTIDADTPTVASLAKAISNLSVQMTSYLGTHSMASSGFSADSYAVPESAEYEALRAPMNDAALDLLRLINGPKNSLRSFFFSHYDLAALQVALDRGFFYHVPLADSDASGNGLSEGNKMEKPCASISEIAKKVGMDEDRTGRILRLLATHRIFQQVQGNSDKFQHTAASALLARDSNLYATADMQMDDMLRAASDTSTVINRSPYVSSPKESAFSTAYGMSMYEYYEQHPLKAKRFAQAMSSWSQMDRQISDLRDAFPWESLMNGKVVDIGGGSGHISIALARQFPTLHFVVQDISTKMLLQCQGEEIQDLNGRVTFQQHNFFDPQPVHDAGAFLLRQCLHNNNDSDCIKIIRAVVPALEKCKEGTSFLINDVIMPQSGTTTRYEEHHLRQVDFCMMALLGAKQRTEQEFKNLLRAADPRLEIAKVYHNPLGVGLLEVHLNTKNQSCKTP